VLQGPGCLSYAFVLPIALHADLRDIRRTNEFFLRPIATALSRWQPAITLQGISDLAVDRRKISGNAQRRTRTALLFHGTLLHGMQAKVISRYLKEPKRQPEYRNDRRHDDFLRTIDVLPDDIKNAIADVWKADIELKSWPQLRMRNAMAKVAERSTPLQA
jgi:lipoate---protein ligase